MYFNYLYFIYFTTLVLPLPLCVLRLCVRLSYGVWIFSFSKTLAGLPSNDSWLLLWHSSKPTTNEFQQPAEIWCSWRRDMFATVTNNQPRINLCLLNQLRLWQHSGLSEVQSLFVSLLSSVSSELLLEHNAVRFGENNSIRFDNLIKLTLVHTLANYNWRLFFDSVHNWSFKF